MFSIEETELPGIGRRFEVTTNADDRLFIILHDSGMVELYDSRPEDPQRPSPVATFNNDEARFVAAIIGRTIYKPEAIERLGRHSVGITWVQLKTDSYAVGKTIGELLQNTKASVLTVIEKDGKSQISVQTGYVIKEGSQLALAGEQKEVQAIKVLMEKGK